VTRIGLALEQHLSPAFDRIGARRRGLYCDLVGRDSGLGQSGSHGLGAVERSTEAVQLLGRSAAGPGIADDAHFPWVFLIQWEDFPEDLPILSLRLVASAANLISATGVPIAATVGLWLLLPELANGARAGFGGGGW